MNTIEISDDECTDEVKPPTNGNLISSDEDHVPELSSDEEPPIRSGNKVRQPLLNNMFPRSKPHRKLSATRSKDEGSSNNTLLRSKSHNSPIKCKDEISSNIPEAEKRPAFKKMIGGIEVNLPVDPYGSQIALMFKVIQAINKSQNCLLESPTGSGKTLALLCAALAWQKHEQDKVAKENANQYFSDHPDLNQLPGAAQYITTPTKKTIESPEEFFSKPVHGEKSIYNEPTEEDGTSSSTVRQKHMKNSPEEENGLVTIHKRRKLNESELSEDTSPPRCVPPENTGAQLETNQEQNQEDSVPTIYYGARTHKQLQQVIREFGRTEYCRSVRMSILSSRDNSCIRHFDRSQWSTKNDMCRGCTKKIDTKKGGDGISTNCKYYDNRKALTHSCLPPAFDLRALVAAGEEILACPFYAAREMAHSANIVFCPYNYLIDPSIRSSMQINLPGNVLIIDEAHNIEDICRDAASCVITRDQVLQVLQELETVANYRFANSDASKFIGGLVTAMTSWNQWFTNQLPLVNHNVPNNGESCHVWDAQHFLKTLHNHNIGAYQYPSFQRNVEMFSKQMREDSGAMIGVTQATTTLLETISVMQGYLFRDNGQFADDFRPVLQRGDAVGSSQSWRSADAKKSERDSLSLRLICLNSAVVFVPLTAARCVVLASGTLTPLISLHSELGTTFPLQISPNHVIPRERVWIGSLGTDTNGDPLRCTSGETAQPRVQDALGAALLRVARLTPHGVLCFLPSYRLMNLLATRWQETGVWDELQVLKHVFMEKQNVRDHDDIMEDYYKYVESEKGAVLFAVYRGKVSEGMDFKDNQARCVVAVGIPYPNTFDLAVKEKMSYNDKYSRDRKLLAGREWLRVQAYRALNQAVGRCVRHRGDWGAVLLVDERFRQPYYTQHISGWAKNMLGNNHHSYASLVEGPTSLTCFMSDMRLREEEDV